MMLFGISTQAIFGQVLIGLINGSFYALLSLGLAVIFGLLGLVNFAHGAIYMLGAFVALLLFEVSGVGYWAALLVAPMIVAAAGIVVERLLLRRIQGLDHTYGLLLTFGMALFIEGTFRHYFGVSGLPYGAPRELAGGRNLGFMYLPDYRAWVLVISITVCTASWALIEKTRLGSRLRAATQNPRLVEAFGVNVPLMITLTYGAGVALAAFAGVMAAPIYQVSPIMGTNIVVVVFAVVVIGGMGSIGGAIISGYGLGLIEGVTKVVYPEASNSVIFLAMIVVLLARPTGLFGRSA